MKRIIVLVVVSVLLVSCSKSTKQLSSNELDGLSTEEKIEKITRNALSDYDNHYVLDGNSLAVYYASNYVHESDLIAGEKDKSFPNTAMTLLEHLSAIDFNEVVIVEYDPRDVDGIMGLTRVSALFDKESINEETFGEWEEADRPSKFYRLSDAYDIRDMYWEKLNDDEKKVPGKQSKKGYSDFWEYYGFNIVEN